jgi:hypothetical protein
MTRTILIFIPFIVEVFVASIGGSLEEFAEDVWSVLDF